MNIITLLEMAAEATPSRIAVGPRSDGITYERLHALALDFASQISSSGYAYAAFVDLNTPAFPVALFGAAAAGLPFAPLNFRLPDTQIDEALARLAPVSVVAGDEVVRRMAPRDGVTIVSSPTLLHPVADDTAPDNIRPSDSDAAAVLLFTSGTSGQPKAAVLRHHHLSTYIVTTVEFQGADDDDAVLISVPNYHIAGISSVLSAVYAGRRIVQLPIFSPERWVETAVEEGVTQAMVVPTMLGRILDVLERTGLDMPRLRLMSYGGGRMPAETIERALRTLPHVDFVNAYGLTETSSTISILDPDDHRDAFRSTDLHVRARLGSVGRPLPTIEIQIRDAGGEVVTHGMLGEIYVRGDQVAGEYLSHSALEPDGWYPTRDRGYLDASGYLYLDGRADDVIVRGAENISPGEIEDVLIAHPDVVAAAVVGVPDIEWGEAPEAVIVLRPGREVSESDLQDWVRIRLRSTRVPVRIHTRSELPYNETGKLLRRVLRDELVASHAPDGEVMGR